MARNEQLLLPIDSLCSTDGKEMVQKGKEKANNVSSLNMFKREKEQEVSSQKIKEYLDSYKIFA